MRQIMQWFFLSAKRYLKKPSFVLVLLVLPAAALFVRRDPGSQEQSINIALYTEARDEQNFTVRLTSRLAERKTGDGAGMFSFYLCDSQQQLEEDVAAKRAECGYVFDAGLEEKLDRGQFKRSILVYSSPASVVTSLSTETVVAELLSIYDKQLLTGYIGENELFHAIGRPGTPARMEAAGLVGGLYDKWSSNDSTFRFTYQYLGRDNTIQETRHRSWQFFPVRGLAAVFLFVTGLYSGVMLLADERKGLFLPLSYGMQLPCRLAALAAPVALAVISGLLAIWVSGMGQGAGKEVAVMCFYAVGVTLFSFVLKLLTRSPEALSSLIPFFALGSLVFCPVFLDAGQILPVAAQIEKWFVPYYYLKWF